MPRSAPEDSYRPEDVTVLIATAREGSEDARNRLLEACRHLLLAIANRELPPEYHAKCSPSDLVQQTLYKAHAHFGRFHGDSETELVRWLRRILRNLRINAQKHYRRRRRDLRREVALGGSETGVTAAPPLRSPEPSPSAQAMQGEADEERKRLQAALNEALARLAETDRQVVLLRQQEGRTWEEIGTRLGCTGEAARKLWTRAVLRLRKQLGNTHDADGR